MNFKTPFIIIALISTLASSLPLHCMDGNPPPAQPQSGPWTRYATYACAGLTAATAVASMGYLATGLKPTQGLIDGAKILLGAGSMMTMIFGGINSHLKAEKDINHKQFSTGFAVLGGICSILIGASLKPSPNNR